MRGLTKFLLIAIAILLVFLFFLNKSEEQHIEEQKMENLVGEHIGGGELSVNDYYTLKQCLESYNDFLNKKDFENAYKMFGASYRNYVPLEEYTKLVENHESGEIIVKDINVITATTFDLLASESGDDIHYSIIINNDNSTFAIFPYSFLDYKKPNTAVKKGNIEITLEDYIVNIDKCIFNFNINGNIDNLNILNIEFLSNLDDKIEVDEYKLDGNKLTVEIPVNYTFPKNLDIKCKIKDKDNDFNFSF